MQSLLPLISAFLSGEVGETLRRTKRNAAYGAFIAFFALLAIVFALVAATIALAGRYGALHACLFMAGGAAVMAIVAWIALRIAAARERRRARERAKSNRTLLAAAALTALPMLLRSRPALLISLPLLALGGFSLLSGRGDAVAGNDDDDAFDD